MESSNPADYYNPVVPFCQLECEQMFAIGTTIADSMVFFFGVWLFWYEWRRQSLSSSKQIHTGLHSKMSTAWSFNDVARLFLVVCPMLELLCDSLYLLAVHQFEYDETDMLISVNKSDGPLVYLLYKIGRVGYCMAAQAFFIAAQYVTLKRMRTVPLLSGVVTPVGLETMRVTGIMAIAAEVISFGTIEALGMSFGEENLFYVGIALVTFVSTVYFYSKLYQLYVCLREYEQLHAAAVPLSGTPSLLASASSPLRLHAKFRNYLLFAVPVFPIVASVLVFQCIFIVRYVFYVDSEDHYFNPHSVMQWKGLARVGFNATSSGANLLVAAYMWYSTVRGRVCCVSTPGDGKNGRSASVVARSPAMAASASKYASSSGGKGSPGDSPHNSNSSRQSRMSSLTHAGVNGEVDNPPSEPLSDIESDDGDDGEMRDDIERQQDTVSADDDETASEPTPTTLPSSKSVDDRPASTTRPSSTLSSSSSSSSPASTRQGDSDISSSQSVCVRIPSTSSISSHPPSHPLSSQTLAQPSTNPRSSSPVAATGRTAAPSSVYSMRESIYQQQQRLRSTISSVGAPHTGLADLSAP